MERISSNCFFERMPEAFPEPSADIPSKIQNHFRRRAEVEEKSRAEELNGLICADLRQSIRESLDTTTDSPTDPTFASPTLYKRTIAADAGKALPADSRFSCSPNDDVFDNRQTRNKRPKRLPMSTTLNAHSNPAEQREYREGSYKLYLARFYEVLDYYVKPSTSAEQWASKLGMTDAEWAEKVNESEAQVFLRSIIEDENLYEVSLSIFFHGSV